MWHVLPCCCLKVPELAGEDEELQRALEMSLAGESAAAITAAADVASGAPG